jgi:hypothetical protein
LHHDQARQHWPVCLDQPGNLGERLPNPRIPSGTHTPGTYKALFSHARRHPRIPKDPSGRHP